MDVELKQDTKDDFEPECPSFLQGLVYNVAQHARWQNIVLPWITTLIFICASTTDVLYLTEVLAKTNLFPDLHRAIVNIKFPHWYHFSGVTGNRRAHPCFVLASRLPNLREMSLTVHTSSLTIARDSDGRMHEIDTPRACQLKLKPIEAIVSFYDLDGIFRCTSLQRVGIEYLASSVTEERLVQGDLVDIMTKFQNYVSNGFAARDQNVVVTLV